MFTCSDPDNKNESITPILWPIIIFLADYTVEDMLQQSTMNAQSAADEKLTAILTEMEQRQNRTTFDLSIEIPYAFGRSEKLYRTDRIRVPKPHQPRFTTKTCHVSDQQQDSPLLLFTTKIEQTNNSEKDMPVSTFLLDSGA